MVAVMSRLYYPLFNCVALAVVLYIGVDIFYGAVRSELTRVRNDEYSVQQPSEVKRERKAPLAAFNVIAERNLFGSVDKASESGKEEEMEAEEIDAIEPTSLKIVLLGTVAGDEEDAYAVIEETEKKKQGLFRTGDSIQIAVIKKIMRGRVILKVGDKHEMLTMEDAGDERKDAKGGKAKGSASPGGARTVTVKRDTLRRSLNNINELLTQVRVRPHFTDGQSDGLAISQIRPNSIFSRLGLKDGDVVKGVNGRDIKGPDDILEFYNKLKTGSGMSLQMQRGGEPKTINYEFK